MAAKKAKPRGGAAKSKASSKRSSAKPHARAGASKPKPRPAAKRAAPKRAAPKPAAKRSAPKAESAPRAAAPIVPSVPSGIGLEVHHLDYTTHDLHSVKRFYTEMLGFTQAMHDPDMNYLMVQTTSGSSLGFMPPMPGPPEEWRPPREPALYFIVSDVDQAHRDLTARGIAFDSAPQDMPWGHRVANLRDPEGRRISLAQRIKP